MEATTLLCDSYICRLCGEQNENGTNLFALEENKQDLSELVNKYLPLKIVNNQKYPRTICPGCNFQLEATKLFFDLIIEGQAKLRDILSKQQETLRRQEKQKQQLVNALKNVNPTSSVETYTIQADEAGERFLIQILSDGPLFPPEHELMLKTQGLERPRRKRGRPPKPPQLPNTNEPPKQQLENRSELEAEEEPEYDAEGRRKRKIKVPTRYQEVLQGKEMDRIFKEEGVINEDSMSEDEQETAKDNENMPEESNEIIGHMQGKDGEDLGQLVVVNKNSTKVRVRPKNGTALSRKKKRFDCEICGRVFLHSGRLEVHKSFHKNFTYQCSEKSCQFQTDTKTVMEIHHKRTKHSGITLIEPLDYGQVQLPQIKGMDMEDLEKEMGENLAKEVENTEECSDKPKTPENKVDAKLECKICLKHFSCKQNYEVHLKAVHENRKPYKCDKCNKKFAYLNSLKCHMLQHSDKIYPCDSCEKIFNHPSSLVYHREAEHNNGRRYVCNKCRKTFKHKQLLLRHQLVHTNDRPHICKYCEASFKTRANLLNHMPMHTGEKKYYCFMCGQAFAHKTSLTLHTRWHNGQKPYECDVCMKTFSQKGNLAEHKRIHTGEKPYCCDHCGRKFTTSSQYKLHVKRHTGERPWQCEYCSKNFLHKDTWKCHTRRHRNERPYQCPQCLRGFTEQWALKKHQRLHTGEKPYTCEICNKCFADSSNLTKHKKIHFNDKTNQKTVRGNSPGSIKVVTSEEGEKFFYLTYEDGVTDTEPHNLVQIMDPATETTEITNQPTNITMDINEELSVETSLQVQQVFDNDGIPLSLTTAAGEQIKVVMSIEEGTQSIQGLLADGTLVPLNLTMQDGKSVAPELLTPAGQSDSKGDDEIGEVDNLNMDGSKDLPESSVDQLLENSIQFLTEDGQKLDNNIQFLTEDGQKLDNNIQFLTEDGQKLDNNIQFLTEDGQKLDNNIQFLTDDGQKLDNNIQFLTEDGQKLDNNIQFLTEDGQKLDNNIQFLTEDGQNVCFVTTYIDDSINPQYLAMS